MFSAQSVLKELMPIFALKTDELRKMFTLGVPSHNLIWCENNAHINYLSLFLISKWSNCKVKSV